MSTGRSSLKAVDAVRMAGGEVLGMAAMFTYGFPIATKAFKKEDVRLVTLCDYDTMIESALDTGYIKPTDVETLQAWRKDPANWLPGALG